MIAFCSELKGTNNAEVNVKNKVFEAFDYLTVMPSKSLDTLRLVESKLQVQPINIQIKAYATGMWAAHYLSSPDIAEHYSRRLTSLASSDVFEENSWQILSVLSSQIWRLGDNESAKIFLLCAVPHADSVERLLSNILSLGSILRREKELWLAQQVYNFGMELAVESDNKRFAAGIYNNASVIAMETGDLNKALAGFEKALNIRYEISHLPGQVVAGTNLMLAYLFKQEWNKFERLAFRMERLLTLQNSPTYLAYFNWLKMAFALRGQTEHDSQELAKLTRYFYEVDERGIQMFLLKVATCLEIEMPGVSIKARNLEKATELQSYVSVCDWKQLSTMNGTDILQKLSLVAAQITHKSQ